MRLLMRVMIVLTALLVWPDVQDWTQTREEQHQIESPRSYMEFRAHHSVGPVGPPVNQSFLGKEYMLEQVEQSGPSGRRLYALNGGVVVQDAFGRWYVDTLTPQSQRAAVTVRNEGIGSEVATPYPDGPSSFDDCWRRGDCATVWRDAEGWHVSVFAEGLLPPMPRSVKNFVGLTPISSGHVAILPRPQGWKPPER
jgi:hypothetical protein